MIKGQNSKERVKLALIKGGYTDNEDIQSSHYIKTSGTGHEIHEITFQDHEGKIRKGRVFIKDGIGDF